MADTESIIQPGRTVRLGSRTWRRWLPPLIVFAVVAAATIFAPFLTPYGPAQLGETQLAPPSLAHWFGSDELGRDLLTRVLYGGRISLLVAVGATTISMIIGVLWGLAAALSRSFVSEPLMRLADIVMGIPGILLALVFVAAFGTSIVSLMVIIGILLSPSTARLSRAVALGEVQSDYALAARAYGASPARLVFRELLPNMAPQLAVQATVNAAHVIMIEASLSFVGLGVQPPDASWGTLVRAGYDRIYDAPGYAIFPGLLMVVTVWSLNSLGDRLGATPGTRALSA